MTGETRSTEELMESISPELKRFLSKGAAHQTTNSNHLGAQEELFPTTDTGNAELLADLFGDKIRYDHRRKRWLLWNEHRWQHDSDGYVTRVAIESARKRFEQAKNISDLDEKKKVVSWAISSESRMKLDACISVARNINPITDTGENWDNNIWLLGVKNGVVDLKTGELRQGKPEDRITMTTNVDFDPQAKCERWEQFLKEVFGDDGLIDWLWRVLGYSITGGTSEQCVFIGHGTGRNGKGRFNHALMAALGDYAHNTPFSTFEMSQRTTIPNDMAALEFKRFVNSSETNDTARLNEARIKTISGCDPVSARYLHQEFFTFIPHFKLWLFVNHKPKVVDDSYGFWRRVRLIPFTRCFEGASEDKQLDAKLEVEAGGILAWLVRGCLEWQKRGLEPIPECVKVATQEYKQESDTLAGFIADKCAGHPQATIKASELFNAYKDWAEGEGMLGKEVLTSTTFGRRMRERYSREHNEKGNFYKGIGLITDGFLEGFVPTVTKNNVSSIYNISHEVNRKTLQNSSAKAKNPSFQAKNPSAQSVEGDGDSPDYPHVACRNCGSIDYWLRGKEWLCSRCHPQGSTNE